MSEARARSATLITAIGQMSTRVVRGQGNLKGEINPADGIVLDYDDL